MSGARSAKSGLNRTLKTSKGSSKNISQVAQSFRSILKQAARKLPVLDSLQDQTLRLLFQSMTLAQRQEAIGQLRLLNDSVGSLYVRCLRIEGSPKSSKTDFTTLPSSGDHLASAAFQQPKIPCCSITHYNQKVLKG